MSNVCEQIGHCETLWTLLRWYFKCGFWLNLESHTGHTNFLPSWAIKWWLRPVWLRKPLPHNEHWYGIRSPCFCNIWCLNTVLAMASPQCMHCAMLTVRTAEGCSWCCPSNSPWEMGLLCLRYLACWEYQRNAEWELAVFLSRCWCLCGYDPETKVCNQFTDIFFFFSQDKCEMLLSTSLLL